MLSKYLKGNINFLNRVSSWEESIRVASDPLLKKGNITPKYIQDMIDNVNKNGPYIVIVPGIAMPHARNEGGVIKTGISFLKLQNNVQFPEGKEVNIIIVLAAEDNSSHLGLLSDLSSILIDEDVVNKFRDSSNEEEIMNVIKMVE